MRVVEDHFRELNMERRDFLKGVLALMGVPSPLAESLSASEALLIENDGNEVIRLERGDDSKLIYILRSPRKSMTIPAGGRMPQLTAGVSGRLPMMLRIVRADFPTSLLELSVGPESPLVWESALGQDIILATPIVVTAEVVAGAEYVVAVVVDKSERSPRKVCERKPDEPILGTSEFDEDDDW